MKKAADNLSILLVDDNPADVFLIEEMLNSSRLAIDQIFSVDRIAGACDILSQNNVGLILLDLSLPDSFGIETFLKIKQLTNKIPVIIMTGLDDSGVALETLKHGAQDYLVKGEFDTPLLVKSVEYSIERKKAEEKLICSEKKYRQLFYKNPFPTFIFDIETLQILEVNDAAINTYGYNRSEFLQLSVSDIRPTEEIEDLMECVHNGVMPEKFKGRRWRHKKKNGELMRVEVAFYEIDYLGRRAIQSQVLDVTEKVRLENQLREEQELRHLEVTDAVLEAQEKERKGIGQELHDNINQILATARLYLGESIVQEDKRLELIHTATDHICTAIEEIRKLSKALIIPGFIKSGLKCSLEDLIRHILKAKDIHISLDMENLVESKLNENIKINLYRIVQEQLNNILKYADASSISITIRSDSDALHLSIADNGRGFDLTESNKGVGLTNMRSRAGLFNGKIDISSSPGAGCKLEVLLHTGSNLPQKAA